MLVGGQVSLGALTGLSPISSNSYQHKKLVVAYKMHGTFLSRCIEMKNTSCHLSLRITRNLFPLGHFINTSLPSGHTVSSRKPAIQFDLTLLPTQIRCLRLSDRPRYPRHHVASAKSFVDCAWSLVLRLPIVPASCLICLMSSGSSPCD